MIVAYTDFLRTEDRAPKTRAKYAAVFARGGPQDTMPPSARCRAAGRPWTERRRLAALKWVLAAVGRPGTCHTFISNVLVKGVPVALVKEWVGHVDDEIIRHDTHVHNDARQAAMRRLAEANEAPTGGANGRGIAGGSSARNQHRDGERENDPSAK